MTGMLRVLLMLLCLPGVAQAHLLNMTRVNVTVSDEGQAVVTMDVDLTKAMEGGEAYYALTRSRNSRHALPSCLPGLNKPAKLAWATNSSAGSLAL